MNSPMGYKRLTGMCKITITILEFAPPIIKRRESFHLRSDPTAAHVLTGSGQQGGGQALTSERAQQPGQVWELFS